MELPQVDDYQSLFLNDVPLLDVRAPVEFNQGAFPGAQNLPLINDEERHAIGIRYKQMGQDKAIELGHKLVQGDVKAARVNDWVNFIQQHPQGVLYCFRGGMRSKISQQWIYDQTGTIYPRVKGGYKALRRYLLNELEKSITQLQPFVISGRTGVGKTLFLKKISQAIDLEAIFKHRGSAFGKYAVPQPSQIDIENQLSIELLKFRSRQVHRIVLEDEAGNIGSRRLPEELIHTMRQAPLILLQAELEERINNVFDDYINQALAQYQEIHGIAEGFNAWSNNLLDALEKIQRRLGGQRYQETKKLMFDAMQQHQQHGEAQAHKHWIELLLVNYYDPMYDYQIEKKQPRMIYSGDATQVIDYLSTLHQIM